MVPVTKYCNLFILFNNANILLNGRSIACGGRQDHQIQEALVSEQTPTGTGMRTGEVTKGRGDWDRGSQSLWIPFLPPFILGLFISRDRIVPHNLLKE